MAALLSGCLVHRFFERFTLRAGGCYLGNSRRTQLCARTTRITWGASFAVREVTRPPLQAAIARAQTFKPPRSISIDQRRATRRRRPRRRLEQGVVRAC